jgi:drug/metabolite transporter (DMT)-like permease
MGYIYIAITIILSSYGQLILKWRLNQLGALPTPLWDKFVFLFWSLFDPYIFSSFVAAFFASLTWMAALSKFQLSFAYPFMSISFILVMVASYWLLGEQVTIARFLGCLLIVAGVVLISR